MFVIGIRVANYVGAGQGHLNRCINIRKHLKHQVIWFLDKKEKKILTLYPKDKIYVESNKFRLDKSIIECKKKNINLMLVDSYALKKNTLNKLNKIVFTSLIIDSYKKIYANIVISPQPLKFDKLKNITYLIGEKFAPIEFIKRKKLKIKNTLLVSMGMYDSKGITLKIIKVLKKHYKKKSINFDTIITLGKKSPFLKKIKEEIKEHKNKIYLKVDAKNMDLIYRKSYFAIGAPGLSHFERLAYGVPSILIAQNKKHRLLVEKWNAKNCSMGCKNNMISIEKSILKMLNESKVRNKIMQQGIKFVDGKGSIRIANEINKFLLNNKVNV